MRLTSIDDHTMPRAGLANNLLYCSSYHFLLCDVGSQSREPAVKTLGYLVKIVARLSEIDRVYLLGVIHKTAFRNTKTNPAICTSDRQKNEMDICPSIFL